MACGRPRCHSCHGRGLQQLPVQHLVTCASCSAGQVLDVLVLYPCLPVDAASELPDCAADEPLEPIRPTEARCNCKHGQQACSRV